MTTEPDPMLPGLAEPERLEPELVQAARRTIRHCADQGLLTERDALTCQLILDLARAVARGATSGRASAAAMAAAQLLAALDKLPQPEGRDDDDPFDTLARQLHAAAGTGGLDAAGSGTAGSNAAEPSAAD